MGVSGLRYVCGQGVGQSIQHPQDAGLEYQDYKTKQKIKMDCLFIFFLAPLLESPFLHAAGQDISHMRVFRRKRGRSESKPFLKARCNIWCIFATLPASGKTGKREVSDLPASAVFSKTKFPCFVRQHVLNWSIAWSDFQNIS